MNSPHVCRAAVVRPLLLSLLLACDGDLLSPVPSELQEAPEQVAVDGSILTFSAEVWRNLNPNDADDRLAGTVPLRAGTGSVPIRLKVNLVWVVFNNVAWHAVPHPDVGDSTLLRFSEGPKWPVRETVDVVVRISEGQAGEFLLAAREVPIAEVACAEPVPLLGEYDPGAPGFIVMFRAGVDAELETERLATEYGFEPRYVYQSLPGFAAELDMAIVWAIRCEESVKLVGYNALGWVNPA